MIGKADKNNSNEIVPKPDKEGTHIIGLNKSKPQKEQMITDQKLWIKLKMGCEESFKQLFLTYNGTLTRYGNSIIKDSHIVEDCIHDLFLYIWLKREFLSEVESVKYYLIVSLKRRVFKAIREKEKGQKLLDGIKFEYPQHEEFFQNKFEADQEVLERERVLLLAVDALPQRQREVLHYRYIQCLSYHEIKLEMGISNVSARRLASKAIKRLHKKLS